MLIIQQRRQGLIRRIMITQILPLHQIQLVKLTRPTQNLTDFLLRKLRILLNIESEILLVLLFIKQPLMIKRPDFNKILMNVLLAFFSFKQIVVCLCSVCVVNQVHRVHSKYIVLLSRANIFIEIDCVLFLFDLNWSLNVVSEVLLVTLISHHRSSIWVHIVLHWVVRIHTHLRVTIVRHHIWVLTLHHHWIHLHSHGIHWIRVRSCSKLNSIRNLRLLP